MSVDVDQLLADELDGLNADDIEHLPDEPLLTGRVQSEEIYGEFAEQPVGRASSPLLFAQAAMFENCQQLRVWRIEQGVPVGLGTVAASATEEDLIRAFPQAMPHPGESKATFRVRPLDTNGRTIGAEFTVHVSEHHEILRSIRNAAESSNGSANAGFGISDAQMQLLQRNVEISERRTARAESALEQERERLLEREHELARERVDLAQNAAASVGSYAERMMETDQSRHQQVMETERSRNEQTAQFTAGFFENQLSALRSDRETMLERARSDLDRGQQQHQLELERRREADREAEKEREDRRLREQRETEERTTRSERDSETRSERERRDWERRMEVRDQEAKERQRRDEQYLRDRDSERQRQHELRLKEMEIGSTRDREHAERMMQLSTQKAEASSGTGIGEMLTAGMGFLEKADMDIKDVMGFLRGGDTGGWTELIGTLAERVGSVAEKAIEAKVDTQAAQIENQQMMGVPPHPQPPGMVMVPQQLLQQGVLPQVGMAGPGGVPLSYEDIYGGTAGPQAPAGQSPVQQPAAQDVPLPQPAPTTSLGLQAQKMARGAIRTLVETLLSTPEAEWEGIIAAAISTEMTIYHYVRDVSVSYAMREAGADDTMISKIVASLQASTLIPADIRYE